MTLLENLLFFPIHFKERNTPYLEIAAELGDTYTSTHKACPKVNNGEFGKRNQKSLGPEGFVSTAVNNKGSNRYHCIIKTSST